MPMIDDIAMYILSNTIMLVRLCMHTLVIQ